ncbi:hypothetical protein L3V79_08715 [Thiotrichales bacterium 19S9-12]|nr:hypothetical protein [Thiotrichales bacterium 19S9-11]MCF6812437.1 hypothetical protein [Thiotrichales bacterium 19S9-12]
MELNYDQMYIFANLCLAIENLNSTKLDDKDKLYLKTTSEQIMSNELTRRNNQGTKDMVMLDIDTARITGIYNKLRDEEKGEINYYYSLFKNSITQNSDSSKNEQPDRSEPFDETNKKETPENFFLPTSKQSYQINVSFDSPKPDSSINEQNEMILDNSDSSKKEKNEIILDNFQSINSSNTVSSNEQSDSSTSKPSDRSKQSYHINASIISSDTDSSSENPVSSKNEQSDRSEPFDETNKEETFENFVLPTSDNSINSSPTNPHGPFHEFKEKADELKAKASRFFGFND